MDELKKCVEMLIKRSAEMGAVEALQLSQAACNAANAIAQLQNIEERKPTTQH
jgi:hypothetical protein